MLVAIGRTPLHYAALHGRAAAVEELIKQGAAQEAKDNRGGYTPLHLAADAGQCEVISRLCELGADLEAVSTKGWTPLALANMKVGSWTHAVACQCIGVQNRSHLSMARPFMSSTQQTSLVSLARMWRVAQLSMLCQWTTSIVYYGGHAECWDTVSPGAPMMVMLVVVE